MGRHAHAYGIEVMALRGPSAQPSFADLLFEAG